MAAELGLDGIPESSAVCPATGATDLIEQFLGTDTPEVRARIIANIPQGRMLDGGRTI